MLQVVTENKENKTKAKKAKDNTNYENSTWLYSSLKRKTQCDSHFSVMNEYELLYAGADRGFCDRTRGEGGARDIA